MTFLVVLHLSFYSYIPVSRFFLTHHYKNRFSSLHIFVHHCRFCASLHVKTSPVLCYHSHGRRSLRKSRGDKNRFPLDREIVLKIAKNSFTVVIVDKGLCNVSAVRFYHEIMNGHDRS